MYPGFSACVLDGPPSAPLPQNALQPSSSRTAVATTLRGQHGPLRILHISPVMKIWLKIVQMRIQKLDEIAYVDF